MTQGRSGTLADRYQRGVSLRHKTPREKHADLLGPSDRDPVAILAVGDRTRIPRLIPVRYERMLTSPFAFLRGAAAVMAQDLKHQPSVGIAVQACGDCHLMNFGAFATPEENILFDINDFDETLPGVDFTVDIKRLAASIAVAALAEGFSNKRAKATAAETVEAYRTHMRALAKLSPMEIWHSRIDLAREVKRIEDRSLRRQLHAILTKAGKRLEQDDNFPHLVTGRRGRIVDKPPLIYHLTQKGDVKHRINAERMFGSYQTRLPPERLRLYERYGIDGPCLQGSRGRKRGHVLCHRLIYEQRWRSFVPSNQRSGEISPRMPRAQIQRSSGPAGCRRPTYHAGSERHFSGVVARQCIGSTFLRARTEKPATGGDQRAC